MVGVTLHPPGEGAPTVRQPVETPTQQVVKAGNAMLWVDDERGRRIGWRRLSALEDFDLTEIAGANSSNQEWMIRATIAFGVREIDGEVVARPANKNQLRAIVARLDDAGMGAVLSAVMASGEAAEEANQDRAKNSAGTPTSG